MRKVKMEKQERSCPGAGHESMGRLVARPDGMEAGQNTVPAYKLLFTGFEPFDGDTVNPSWEAVRRLPDELPGICILKACLPVEYRGVRELLQRYLTAYKPDAVVLVGQAGGRATVTPEKVAINWMDAGIPDSAGSQFSGTWINPDGAAAYFATLPVKCIARALREAGIPAEVSYSAGTYVCNSTMYHLMNLIEACSLDTLGGFVHVPYLCSQAAGLSPAAPSLPLETLVRSLEIIAVTIAEHHGNDAGDPEGSVC